MLLTRVTIRHFRNLGIQELEIPAEGVAIVGANAQGKTNFLEAVYYLETFRSFRGAGDDQLVAFGEDVLRVTGSMGGTREDEGTEVAAAFQRQGRHKKVTVDGVEPDRLGDAIGTLAAVVFSPSDVQFVNDGPSARRRFLDIVLSLNQPGYLWNLQRYRQTLAQRNAGLKRELPWSAVRAWDEGLIASGVELMEARGAWIERWSKPFGDHYARVAGGRRATLRYRPNLRAEEGADRAALEEAYREALEAASESERRIRTTMVGPQRDEMWITIDGEDGAVDLRDFGSGGERRTAALALRLVEAGTIRVARQRDPLILLDDVFAELDAERSERVLELIEEAETGQVILTAPKESDVRLRRDALFRWTIEAGRIVA